MSLTDPKGRLVTIGNEPAWARRIVRIATEVGLVPEITSWDGAYGIEPPVCGIVVHVTPVVDALDAFGAWTTQGFQPITIVCLVSSPGAAEFKQALADLGFERILQAPPLARKDGRYWSALEARVVSLAAPNLNVVPVVVDLLGCSDVVFVRLLAAALAPTVVATVQRWCERAGVSRRDLSMKLTDLGLPRPKRTLDLVRLTLALHLATLAYGTLDEIAHATSFPSGDYLGKRCRWLTGRSFGHLVRKGSPVTALVDLLKAG